MSGSEGFSVCKSVAISSNCEATETEALRHQDAQQAPNCWRVADPKARAWAGLSSEAVSVVGLWGGVEGACCGGCG